MAAAGGAVARALRAGRGAAADAGLARARRACALGAARPCPGAASPLLVRCTPGMPGYEVWRAAAGRGRSQGAAPPAAAAPCLTVAGGRPEAAQFGCSWVQRRNTPGLGDLTSPAAKRGRTAPELPLLGNLVAWARSPAVLCAGEPARQLHSHARATGAQGVLCSHPDPRNRLDQRSSRLRRGPPRSQTAAIQLIWL